MIDNTALDEMFYLANQLKIKDVRNIPESAISFYTRGCFMIYASANIDKLINILDAKIPNFYIKRHNNSAQIEIKIKRTELNNKYKFLYSSRIRGKYEFFEEILKDVLNEFIAQDLCDAEEDTFEYEILTYFKNSPRSYLSIQYLDDGFVTISF